MSPEATRPPTPPATATPADASPPSLTWDESWNAETARLAYEHAHAVYRQADETAEVLNRKVVPVFAIASAIATAGPVLRRFPLWSDGWWLTVGAAVMWLLATWQCWEAFKPREYRFDPDPDIFLTPEWLALSPGTFHVHRLASVAQGVREHFVLNNARGAALRNALKCALVEGGLLLAALLSRWGLTASLAWCRP